MQDWDEAVKIAIDILLACIIVVALIVVGDLSRQIMRGMENERAIAEDVSEFRIQHMYDNADCYAQDIVSVVLEYQGNPAVYVNKLLGGTEMWDGTYYSTEMTARAISAVLDLETVYRCTLVYDANGALLAYNFEEM